ncbi:hypothetical protein B0H16DRAFT_1886486 [Mycena metata]|uniref:Uncharacterized protein n=1 Tax=Mycena metata TaxID=1033252 RepID=A0AAD7J2P3_9AGAR|nr:hypothetical protein B0H16DRAFT_1886486 [Mycena metata]
MKNESTNISKSISSCDFQPVPFKKARPASSSRNATTGDKGKNKDEREREQAERETMRESFYAPIPSLRRVVTCLPSLSHPLSARSTSLSYGFSLGAIRRPCIHIKKIAGAEDGAATLTPETEMFLPSAGCPRPPPGLRRVGGGASEAAAEAARREPHGALRDGLTHLRRRARRIASYVVVPPRCSARSGRAVRYRSPEGQCLMLSSRDGYCTLVTVHEILPTHHGQRTAGRGPAFGADFISIDASRFSMRESLHSACTSPFACIKKHPPLPLCLVKTR